MQNVWPGLVVTLETVSQRVKRLRSALDDDSKTPRYIGGVRGRGYRIVAPVLPWVGAVPAAVSPPSLPPPVPRAVWRRYWGVALLVLLLGAPFLALNLRRDTASRTPAVTARASAVVAPKGAVAVLPFANLTGDPGKEYFSDGMAAELINSLAQVAGLRVPARTSSFAYKGRNVDIRQIAHDLDVATILEGSVRSAGERIRVTAELVDARSGYHVWSQSYDRKFSDIFKLQDELAAQIVEALQQYLSAPMAVPSIRTPPTQDVEAYRLYLQAFGTAHGTVPSFREALPLVNEALARDPNFAPALALRAGIQGSLVGMGGAPPSTIDDAEHDAERALTLKPGLSGAYVALGIISFSRGEWIKAEMSYRAALAADGRDALNHGMYSLDVLEPTGRLKQAQAHAQEAFRLAPAMGFTSDTLAGIDSLLGLDADAVKAANLDILIGTRPHHETKDSLLAAHAAARDGRYTDAGRSAAEALPAALRDNGGAEAMRLLYSALADPSEKPEARYALHALVPRVQSATTDAVLSSFFVEAFTMLGELDSAYGLANGLIDRGERLHVAALGLAPSTLWIPEMRPFRLDPRFQDLAIRLKLIDYWKQFGPPDECDLKDGIATCH
jgi:TolB-like protein